MINKLLDRIICLVLFCIVMKANAIKLECSYVNMEFFNAIHEFDKIACEAKDLHVTEFSEKVQQASVNYKDGNDQVRNLRVLQQTLNFIPSGIEKIFPNLRGISIEDSDVIRVFQSNFKAFPELRGLWLRGNKQLEVLERDLFKFNRKLHLLSLSNNNIQHIDPNILDDLSALSFFEFERNSCITNVIVINDPMTELKQSFEENCQDGNALGIHSEFKRANQIE